MIPPVYIRIIYVKSGVKFCSSGLTSFSALTAVNQCFSVETHSKSVRREKIVFHTETLSKDERENGGMELNQIVRNLVDSAPAIQSAFHPLCLCDSTGIKNSHNRWKGELCEFLDFHAFRSGRNLWRKRFSPLFQHFRYHEGYTTAFRLSARATGR